MNACSWTRTSLLTFSITRSRRNRLAPSASFAQTREIFVSTQVPQELHVSLTKGRKPIATAANVPCAKRSRYSVIHVDTALVFAGIEASRRHRISFWDALSVRAAVQADCEALLSEDLNPGQVIDGVRVHDPFA